MKLNTGDRVQYAAKFLRSAGIYTGEIPFLKGTVTAIVDFAGKPLAHVTWDAGTDHDGTSHVLASNLHKIGTPEHD